MKNKKLHNKKILVGITGSIAAYKIPHFVRLLIKEGAEVKIIASKAALDLVSAVSLSTVAKNPVLSDISDSSQWNNHVDLALWADIFIIAPLTANTLAKLAYGLCDNLLTAVYLSAKCPIYFAPAMDLDMWKHPSTQNNIQKLISYGCHLIPVRSGELASGLIGPGRMAEPEEIRDFIYKHIQEKKQILPYKRAVITAGPTYERLDPVRFIGNFSSGKMGISFAKYLADNGIQVDLVLGPSKEKVQNLNIKVHPVISAEEMMEKVQALMEDADLFIMAAAVSDYRPSDYSTEKIKKQDKEGDNFTINLVKNPDILAYVGKHKKENQTVIGFALETENELENAKKKLDKKKADFILLNSLRDTGAGFGTDTNKVTIISKKYPEKALPLISKDEIPSYVMQFIQNPE